MTALPDVFRGWWLGEAAAAQPPRKPMLEGPATLTYGELADQIARLGGWFAEAGLPRGSRVAVAVGVDAAFVPVVLALLRFGLVPMVVNPEAPAAEAQELLGWLEPDAVIADAALHAGWQLADALPAALPRLEVAPPETPSPIGRWLGRPKGTSETFPAVLRRLAPATPPPPPGPDDLAYILFTSGSTARPKGVELTHGALAAHMRTFSRRFGYGPAARILNVLALHHTDGLFNGPLAAIASGGALVRPFAFSLDGLPALEDALYASRATHFVAVPTMLDLLLRFATAPPERAPDLKMVITSAATLEPRVWEGIIARYGAPVVNVYGLTETVSGSLYAGPDLASMRIGSIGVPDDCEARILAPGGGVARVDEPGELWLRGPHLMRGYFRNPEETAAVLRDGWFATGDVVSMDADGFYWLKGRAKHVIITGGYKVAPDEVSAVLNGHPAVREAATLGRPEPTWGEAVVAAVALDDPAVTADDLLVYARERLAPFKVPTAIYVVPALPRRGVTGKVDLERLRELIAEPGTAGPRPEDDGQAMETAIYALAARCFRVRVEDLGPASGRASLGGWTSLAHMGFVTALQNKFGIHFQTRDIMDVVDLRSAAEVVRRRLALRR